MVTTFSPDNRTIVSVDPESVISVWGREMGQHAIPLPSDGRLPTKSLRFTPDAKFLVAAGVDGTVRIFNTGGDPIQLPPLTVEKDPSSLTFSEDGSVLALLDGSGLRFIGTRPWRRIPAADVAGAFQAIAFDPRGRTVFAVERGRIRRIDTRTWNEQAPLVEDRTRAMKFFRLSFSPDQRWLSVEYDEQPQASRGMNRVKHVWNLQTNSLVAREGEEGAREPSGLKRLLAESAQWKGGSAPRGTESTPDGALRAQLDSSSNTVVLESSIGPVADLEHESAVSAVAFSPDSRWVATATDKGALRLWPLRAADLIDRACKLLPRNLTEGEWKNARFETAYRATCPNLSPGLRK